MPVRLTPGQARALGLDVPPSAGLPRRPRRAVPGHGVSRVDVPPTAATQTPRQPPTPYHSICADCGEEFTVRTVETRHVNATRHARYEITFMVTPDDYGVAMTPEDPDPDPADPDAPPA